MFTRILVPLDGSARAESALPLAAAIARQSDGTVILVRTQTLHVDYSLWGIAPLDAKTIAAEEVSCAEYLARIATSPVLARVNTEKLVLAGVPGTSILDEMARSHADLVVMTSHGRTGLARWVLGSVARQIAYHAPVPVLVLRENGKTLATELSDPTFTPRILVPLDGSALAESAIEPAVNLANGIARQATLHLALVVSPYDEAALSIPEHLLADKADGYLRRVAERIELRHSNIRVTHSISESFDAAEVLIQCAEQGDQTQGLPPVRPADVVVMATHGRSGIATWAMGSVTERVLQSTTLPLLIVRAPTSADQKRAFMGVGATTQPVNG